MSEGDEMPVIERWGFNVYGDTGRLALEVNAATAIEVACREIDTSVEGAPGEHGWLAQAVNDLRVVGAAVRLERADRRWVQIVRCA